MLNIPRKIIRGENRSSQEAKPKKRRSDNLTRRGDKIQSANNGESEKSHIET